MVCIFLHLRSSAQLQDTDGHGRQNRQIPGQEGLRLVDGRHAAAGLTGTWIFPESRKHACRSERQAGTPGRSGLAFDTTVCHRAGRIRTPLLSIACLLLQVVCESPLPDSSFMITLSGTGWAPCAQRLSMVHSAGSAPSTHVEVPAPGSAGLTGSGRHNRP